MSRVEVFPPHGFIELKKWSGDELDIVNAARVSFANESEYAEPELTITTPIDTFEVRPKLLKDKDQGLIKFLLRERHGTPFEQGMMAHWHIKCPIFVARQWFKHRIGCSYNEMSGRYTAFAPDEYYVPEDDVVRTQGGKPGAYEFHQIENGYVRNNVREQIKIASVFAIDIYNDLIEQGVAKEQARIVLPQNMYTEFRWTTNARSLMHFLSLRAEDQAQYEIQQYAFAIEDEFQNALPTVWRAWMDNDRKAP